MAEVGSAYVSLLPSMRGFGRAMESQVRGEVGKSGSRVGSFFGNTLKKGALAVTAAAGGVLGAALFKGFQRLDAIDQAKAKLVGLGHTTKSVDKIMSNALTAVKGTAFGLDEAATAAATAVAAGIKPGQELSKYLSLVGDAATITNSSFSDMARVMNKARTIGAAYNDTLQVLAERGLPVYQMLADKLGVSTAEVKKLASEGKISADVLEDALRNKIGGAALESGKTFTGAFKNMQAALGRVGANLLSGIFPRLKGGFGAVTDALGRLEPVALRVGEALGDALAWAMPRVVDAFKRLRDAVSRVVDALKPVVAAVLPRLGEMLGFVAANMDVIGPAFAAFVGVLTGAKVVIGLVTGAMTLLNAVMLANPVTLAVLAVAGLVAGLVVLYQKSEAFRGAVQALWEVFSSQVLPILQSFGQFLIETVVPAIVSTAQAVGSNLKPVWDALVETFRQDVVPAVQKVLEWFQKAQPTLQKVAGFIVKLVGQSIEFGSAILGKVLPPLIRFAGKVLTNTIRGLELFFETTGVVIGALQDFWGWLMDVKDAALKVIDKIKELGNKFERAAEKVPGLSGALDAVRGALDAIAGAAQFAIDKITALAKLASKLNPFAGGGLPGGTGPGGGGAGVWGPAGRAAAPMESAGRSLMDSLAGGITAGEGAVADAMSRVAGRIAGFVPGSPVKDGPLKAFNDGMTGKELMQFMADGIKDAGPKVVKAMAEQLGDLHAKVKERLDALKQEFASLRDSIASAFTPDLFQATSFEDFWQQGVQAFGDLTKLRAAFKKLKKWGLDPAFLAQLFQSGNTALILDLAEGPRREAVMAGALFSDVNTLASQLGRDVARDVIGPKIDRTNQRLRDIEAAIDRLPKKLARELNGVASDARTRKGS